MLFLAVHLHNVCRLTQYSTQYSLKRKNDNLYCHKTKITIGPRGDTGMSFDCAAKQNEVRILLPLYFFFFFSSDGY